MQKQDGAQGAANGEMKFENVCIHFVGMKWSLKEINTTACECEWVSEWVSQIHCLRMVMTLSKRHALHATHTDTHARISKIHLHFLLLHLEFILFEYEIVCQCQCQHFCAELCSWSTSNAYFASFHSLLRFQIHLYMCAICIRNSSK